MNDNKTEIDRVITRLALEHFGHLSPDDERDSVLKKLDETCVLSNKNIKNYIVLPSIYDITFAAACCFACGASVEEIKNHIALNLKDIAKDVLVSAFSETDNVMFLIKMVTSSFYMSPSDDYSKARKSVLSALDNMLGLKDILMNVVSRWVMLCGLIEKIDGEGFKNVRQSLWDVYKGYVDDLEYVESMDDDVMAVAAMLFDSIFGINLGSYRIEDYNRFMDVYRKFLDGGDKHTNDDVLGDNIFDDLSDNARRFIEGLVGKL